MEGKGLKETLTVSALVHGERYSSCAALTCRPPVEL